MTAYVHPIAGWVNPADAPCSRFTGDGRSELCAFCDWPDTDHKMPADEEAWAAVERVGVLLRKINTGVWR